MELNPHAGVFVDLWHVVPWMDVAISRPFTGPNCYQATAYLHGRDLTEARGPTRLAALIAVLQEVEKLDDLQS